MFGIPTQTVETSSSLKQNVVDIGTGLGVTLKEEGIDTCHCINGGNGQPTTGIIFKFVRRDDLDKFLERRKVKQDLSTPLSR